MCLPISALLETLVIKGAIVTIDAAGTHAPIAEVIKNRGADYVLAVKDNQPKLADSIRDFYEIGKANDWKNVKYDCFETTDYGQL